MKKIYLRPEAERLCTLATDKLMKITGPASIPSEPGSAPSRVTDSSLF